MSKKLGLIKRSLLLALLVMPIFQSKAVQAQAPKFVGEWEITFEVVEGKPRAIWIGRVWDVDEEGVETLRGEVTEDISASCATFGNPQFGEDHVTLDGVDDYLTCTIPNFSALFAQIEPGLANCRCRFNGPPYAAADISPAITTEAQPVIYHRRLHLDIRQRENVADLELEKSVSHHLAQVGSSVVFSLTVTNQGPANTSGVSVEEKLPSGYSYVSDSSGGRYNPENGRWLVGVLEVGASATLHITATVNESGDYTNVAQIATSRALDPDSTPGNDILEEDDIASAGINPNALFVHFPLVSTGALEENARTASVAAVSQPKLYGVAELKFHFLNEEERVFASNLIHLNQANGVQLWGGYNAARYVTNNDPEGFPSFLSSAGFWDDVQPDYVEGLYFWESEAPAKYDSEPMPEAGFSLDPGTRIYIGHNPISGAFFEGTVRAAAIDPGCRGH